MVVRKEILSLLQGTGAKCSILASVCQEWKRIIEPLNFAKISLTVPRLADPESQAILLRRRDKISYIWFRIEMKDYDCSRCHGQEPELWAFDDEENQFIVDAFESLFTALSKWEPRGDLVLDISLYSPNDNQHRFKYLDFSADEEFSIEECASRAEAEQATTQTDDLTHGWVSGKQTEVPDSMSTDRISREIMAEGPFDDDAAETRWWQSLPEVPVVGVVLLRQQTRSRWRPAALADMLSRFRNLKEICYEPWREFTQEMQPFTDRAWVKLVESLTSTKLDRLTLFENNNETYARQSMGCRLLREPNKDIGRSIANLSMQLESLSASFIIGAGHIFAVRRIPWTWDRLSSLALTAQVLTNEADPLDIDDLIQQAGNAAYQMPRLQTMEIWNGRRGTANLFRYQRAPAGQLALLTFRGTMRHTPGTSAINTWYGVAYRHQQRGVDVRVSSVDPDLIKCPGDAIYHLGLTVQVMRPTSLRQTLRENRLQAQS